MSLQSRLYRKSTESRIFDTAIIIVLGIYAFLTLYPLIYVIVQSMTSAFDPNPYYYLWPVKPQFWAYTGALRTAGLGRAYLNTIIISVGGTILTLVITLITAYPLTVEKLPFRRFLMFAITFTMLFSGGMIPFYLQVKNLKLMDTYWAIILPGAVSAWNIIVMRTYMMSNIPREMSEAASIDGAGYWLVLIRIVTPLCKPIMAVISLFTAVGLWNSYFGPMIFLNRRDLFPLALLLREIVASRMASGNVDLALQTTVTPTALRSALIIISIAPIMCVYPFLQKYFTQGIMLGSLKG